MTIHHPTTALLGALLAAGLFCTPVQAEKADRNKPITVEADKPGIVDLQRQLVVFNGNVLIVQGSLRIRADRVELRERDDGYRAATAIGGAGRQATFSQKRDGVDETIEGAADRIEYDARTDILQLIGHASVRRLRDGVLADEVIGSHITWDNNNELFSVQGGVASPTNPGGRVRAVFAPPQGAASAASGAASAVPLKSATGLGAPR